MQWNFTFFITVRSIYASYNLGVCSFQIIIIITLRRVFASFKILFKEQKEKIHLDK